MNELLREVVADALERLADADERLRLLTVTAVRCEPDLRRASVLLSELPAEAAAALDENRPRMQRAVADQVRLRRTPQLSFCADPAVEAGQRVEQALRRARETGQPAGRQPGGSGEQGAGPEGAPGEQGAGPEGVPWVP
ncbi:MAG: ribosome-binding factor A [Acidimicrobiales bacterium]